jgi:hypothetical protein
MDALDAVLSAAAVSLVAFALAGVVFSFLSAKQVNLACGISQGAMFIGNIAHHRTLAADFNAAAVAVFIWLWWNNGGGDDTKRRLRQLGAAFRGVRRTAPSPA